MGILADRNYSEQSDHIAYNRVWCAKADINQLVEDVETVCKANGGVYGKDGWCTKGKAKTPIFYADVAGNAIQCSGGYPGLKINALFPAKGTDYTNPAWQKFVLNYKASLIKKAEQLRQAEFERQQQEKDQALSRKLAADKLMNARAGTRACRYKPLELDKWNSVGTGTLVGANQVGRTVTIQVKYCPFGKCSIPNDTRNISDNADNWYICPSRKKAFSF